MINILIADDHTLMREGLKQMLGGTLAIDSEPGRGTHIEVNIPRNPEPVA